jgi:hypothetical protein
MNSSLMGMMPPMGCGMSLPGMAGGMPPSGNLRQGEAARDEFNGRSLQDNGNKSRRTMGMVLVGVVAGFAALLGGRALVARFAQK